MLLSFKLVLAAICSCYTSATVTLPAIQYTDESADLGSYFVEISVGRPQQLIRAQVDTGSGYVVVPAEDCAGCSATGSRTYDRSLSGTMRIVPCHSNECLHVEGTDTADGAPTICVIQIGNAQVCPKLDAGRVNADASGAFDGRMALEGAGQCLLDPAIEPGPAVACTDHLEVASADGSPMIGTEACAYVLQMSYTCDTLMSAFDSGLKGTLKDVCSEMCGQCSEGPVRFCDDNPEWTDAEGQGCNAYRTGAGKHVDCFAGDGAASLACPIACGSCGDCCARPTSARSASAEPECYFFMHYVDGTIVSGSKVKEHIDLQPSADADALYGERSMAPVLHAAVGVFSHVDSRWEPSGDVDGVLGLSSGVACNPSCEQSFLDHMWEANPWLPKVFALCLSTAITDGVSIGNGAVDLGGVVTEHYHEPLVWLNLLLERQLMGDMGYTINTPVLDLKIGGISIVHNARPAEEESAWSTSAELAGYAVAIDSGVTGILLPLQLFAAVAALFTQITPSFNEQNPLHGKRNTSLLWPNQGRPESVCGGPVTADYEPSSDFHTISLVLAVGGGGSNFTIELGASDYLIKNSAPEISRIRLPNGAKMNLQLAGGQQYLCNSIGVSSVATNSEHGRREKIVLGGTFLQQYYAAFDLGRERVGIAKAADCAHPGPPPPPPCEVPTPQHGSLGSCPKLDEIIGTARTATAEESGWLPGGASCEITCDDGYLPVGHLTADTSSLSPGSLTAASQSYAEAPQFVICGMDGNLIGVTTCELGGDACISDPCEHGSACVEIGVHNYECRCSHGFTGTNCEIATQPSPSTSSQTPPPSPSPIASPCDGTPCGQHGENCVPLLDRPESHSCTCEEGWEGDNCDIRTDEHSGSSIVSNRPPPQARQATQHSQYTQVNPRNPGTMPPDANDEVPGGRHDEIDQPRDGISNDRATARSTTSVFSIENVLLTAAVFTCVACWWYRQEGAGACSLASQGRGGHSKGGAYKLVPQRDHHLA